MSNWIQAAVWITGALFAVFATLIIAKPRVCRRVAQYIGGIAASMAGSSFMALAGAFIAKRAVLAQAASDYAITAGASVQDRHVLDKLAAAIDPTLGVFLGMTVIACIIVAECIAGAVVARMIIEDEADARTNPQPAKAAKPEQGGN